MKFPKEVLVYVFDYDEDGKQLFAVVTEPSEIPEDCNGERVGRYRLESEWIVRVKHELVKK